MPVHRRHDPEKSLVGFIVGEVHYAVPISRVRELTNPRAVITVPHAPAAVAGVADYRGEVVPVVDLRVRFGLESIPATRRTKWIVVDLGDRFVALVVDAITDVFGTGGAELRPAPPLGGGEDLRGFAGVTSLGDHTVFVLEASRFGELTAPVIGRPPSNPGLMAPVIAQQRKP